MDFQFAEVDKIFCSKCANLRAAAEFEVNKKGQRNRTCKRHSRKRALELHDWDSFTLLLRSWKKQASNFNIAQMGAQINARSSLLTYSGLLARSPGVR